MKTFHDVCEEYLDAAFPDGCSLNQRSEMRDAFYAGAYMALGAVADEAVWREIATYASARVGEIGRSN